MPNANDLLQMLERACAFTVSVPAHEVDPDVLETIDRSRADVSRDLISAVTEFLDGDDRNSGE